MNRLFGLLSGATLTLALISPATHAAESADSLIQAIKDRGALRACHAEALPWGAKDPKTEEWVGTDIEAAKHLAETIGVEIEHVDSTWATLIPSLETDKCDIVMAPMFRTPERAMRILFAEPSGYETQGVAVLTDSGSQQYADLDKDGMTIAVLSGTADEAFANRFFKNAEVKPFVSDKLSTIFLEVASRRADGVLTDSSTLRNFIKENPAMKLRILEAEPLNPQGYSYAVRPGEYHFVEFVNVWQQAIEMQGLRDQWYEKYAE
ncbi:MAG: ABC transporter substrate-binding protein [Gammaproteobacteria bacterium]|nr:ABC transporter substrate-binding protein [Gammaproteobacteria bacterium]